MNKQDPTDSTSPPSNENATNQAGAARSETSGASQGGTSAQTRQTGNRRTRRKRAEGYKARFESLKARLQSRLGDLDNDRLKKILITCGIAAVLAVAIIALIKSIPVGLAILAILGLGVVVRFLEELRHLPVLNTL